MLDEISKKILKTTYGFGIMGTKFASENCILPHCSSSGLQAIISDVPKTTFYRKLNNLEKEGYITIKKKKKLSRKYEIINGQRITIPSRYSKAREVQLTEKGKKIVSNLLTNEFPRKIDVVVNQKVKRMLFIDAVEYLRTHFGVEIHTAFFYLLNYIEKKKIPIDLEKIGQEISIDR
jgi:hypothetical protein